MATNPSPQRVPYRPPAPDSVRAAASAARANRSDGERLHDAITDHLWHQLDRERREAYRLGAWTIACEAVAELLVWTMLDHGTVTPWERIPPTLLADGTYEALASATGMAYDRPDLSAVERVCGVVRVQDEDRSAGWLARRALRQSRPVAGPSPRVIDVPGDRT